jgi:hypothetical protein
MYSRPSVCDILKEAAFCLAVVLLLYSIVNPASPACKEPISYEGPVQPDPPTLPQTGAIAKPSLGPYQHRFRDLRLQLEVIKLYILRTGKTVHAETMASLLADMDQLATLMNHLPGNHPISDRYASAVAKELDSIKNLLDAVERHLEL